MARPGDKSPRARATPRAGSGLSRALDEVRFGASRTLNLRESLPSGAEAVGRAEAWLRERQAAGCGEVLVITGRGRGSLDGVPIVRDAILRLFGALRRAGVIVEAQEHGPGAFVVEMASLQALVDAPRRRHRPESVRRHDPAVLAGLDADTRVALRRLALAALDALGLHEPSESFVADEMIRQFSSLAATVPRGPMRERALRDVIRRALEEFE